MGKIESHREWKCSSIIASTAYILCISNNISAHKEDTEMIFGELSLFKYS